MVLIKQLLIECSECNAIHETDETQEDWEEWIEKEICPKCEMIIRDSI